MPEADAIVTATPGLAIGMLTADCAPVLLCDGEARVIGAAHAGWRGALAGVIEATVKAMRELGAKPERITAVIGPAISQKAYEVGADLVQRFSPRSRQARPSSSPTRALASRISTLPGYVGERLARAGVGAIADLGLCTYCEETAAIQLSPVATSWRGRLRPPNFRHPARLTCAHHAEIGPKTGPR